MTYEQKHLLRRSMALLAIILVVLGGCAPQMSADPTDDEPEMAPDAPGSGAGLTLTSSAFDQGASIPLVYTCDGENISPPLSWRGQPEGTQSLALIMDDPDAPGRTWVHWVVANIPTDAEGLQENVPGEAALSMGIRQGRNSGRDVGYAGPCPPSGTHRYFFKLYALDTELTDLPDRFDKDALLAAMDGHILAQVELMGTYSRQ